MISPPVSLLLVAYMFTPLVFSFQLTESFNPIYRDSERLILVKFLLVNFPVSLKFSLY
jgi:hypothetical protein